MPNVSRRSFATRAVAVAATAAAALGVVALTAPSASAGTSTLFTVTKLGTHRLPAATANQLITLTGTGFDEDLIASVEIDDCVTEATYVVQTATTMLLKTPDDCPTTSSGVITITDTSTDTYDTNPALAGGNLALVFVDAPTIATPSVSVKPVVTENSESVAYANQVTTASTKGGTTIRVKKGAVDFVKTVAYPLSATLGGVALTGVSMDPSGDWFTGVVGAHAASAAPVLKITSNGVSKSFTYATGTTPGTHNFQYAGVGIVVSPASGPIKGGTVLTITGSGFSPTAPTSATVGGVNCPVTATPTTATVFKCTVAAVTTAGPVTVVTTTAGVLSVVSAGSTYTMLSQ